MERGLPKNQVDTRCGVKKYTLKSSTAKAIKMRLHRHVIRRSNGNFVGFPRLTLKIVKNYPMKRNSHFSGEWQI